MSGKQEAVVVFTYEKTQEDELSLKVGEVIQDVVIVDEGWCEGTLNGKTGMFPDNFVELRPAQSLSQPPPASKPSVVRESAAAIKTRRHKVAYSYAADNVDELTLLPGEIVEVIAEEEEGWFKGRLNGKEGVFPSNFLEANPLPAEPTPPEPAPKEEPAAPKQPMMGHKLFPSINPALARSQLKSSAAEKKTAPPIPTATAPKTEKPPEKKATVERAKVTYEYNAENEDEVTIKAGDTVEIVEKNTGQDGWWRVKLGDKVGLVPDNFVEVLPATAHSPPPTTTKTKPPPNEGHQQLPPKETPAPPTKPLPPRNNSVSRPPPSDPIRSSSVSRPPPPDPARSSSVSRPSHPERPHPERPHPERPHPERPPPPTEQKNTPPVKNEGDNSDFGVPHTDPLDSSAIKNRPKKVSRPPSRSNLLMEDGTSSEPPPVEQKTASPWQAEIQKRKTKAPPAAPPKAPKKAAIRPPEKPIASAKPIPAPSKPQTVPKPHVEPTPHPLRDTPSPHPQPVASPVPPPTVTPTHTPAPLAAAAPPADSSWKEAYENLRDDFEKFKKHVKQQFATLTNDLDDERKHWRGLEVDIDRLKKQPIFP